MEDYIQEMTQSQHLARILRLMNSTAQQEFARTLRRIERRKVRVPQILGELRKSSTGHHKTRRLEEELRLLMRKSERDNVMLQKAMQMASGGEFPVSAARKQVATIQTRKSTRSFAKSQNRDVCWLSIFVCVWGRFQMRIFLRIFICVFEIFCKKHYVSSLKKRGIINTNTVY